MASRVHPYIAISSCAVAPSLAAMVAPAFLSPCALQTSGRPAALHCFANQVPNDAPELNGLPVEVVRNASSPVGVASIVSRSCLKTGRYTHAPVFPVRNEMSESFRCWRPTTIASDLRSPRNNKISIASRDRVPSWCRFRYCSTCSTVYVWNPSVFTETLLTPMTGLTWMCPASTAHLKRWLKVLSKLFAAFGVAARLSIAFLMCALVIAANGPSAFFG